MKKVLLLRTNRVDPDPRVEKEVNSLLKNKNVYPEVLAWDRTSNYRYKKEYLNLKEGQAVIHRIGVEAGWGVGIKKNAIAFFKYVLKTSKWLISHRNEYDIIHACDLHTIIPSLIPIFIFRKPYVYDIFDYFSDTAHGNKLLLSLSRKFETFIINNAKSTIICSEKRKKQIIPAHPKELYIIHNSPSEEQIVLKGKKICLTENDNPKVVYVGNLVQDRCIDLVIELAKETPTIEYHIGGIGVLQEYVSTVSNELDNVFYYGKMDYLDVLALENECDIMIALYDQKVPNHKYAAPNKFYEALALGKPLLMLHDTGVDDLIDEFQIGATSNQNVDSLKKSIEWIINNKRNWKKMGEKEIQLFKDCYSWNIMEERLNCLYDCLVEELYE